MLIRHVARALALTCILSFSACMGSPAFAVEIAPVLQPSGVVAQTAVDFSPIFTALIQVGAGVIALIGVPIALNLWNWLREKRGLAKVELTQAQRDQADAVWRKIVGYGVQRTTGLTASMAASGMLTAEVKNDFVRNALDYGAQHFPDVLKQAKVLNSAGGADLDHLERILDARLGMLAISQATSPQTLATSTDASTHPAAGAV